MRPSARSPSHRGCRPLATLDSASQKIEQIEDIDAAPPQEAKNERAAFGLARREALWAIRALRDEPLPLFAAASARETAAVPEISEPAVLLRPMTAGGEVVQDYGHVGLSLRAHPVSFLREDLRKRRNVSCAEAMSVRDGRWLEAAGIVLVRQQPGSAKGVLFMTLEVETRIANLMVWPKVFEVNRRTFLATSMMAVRGRVHREGEVVRLVAQRARATDLSAELPQRRQPRCRVPASAWPRRSGLARRRPRSARAASEGFARVRFFRSLRVY